MSSLLRAAYFKLCACGTHASILLEDHDLSGPFFAKKAGKEKAEELKASGRISSEECALICESIASSPLPYHATLVMESDIAARIVPQEFSPQGKENTTYH